MTAGRKNSKNYQDWGTPEKYVEAVRKVFRGFIDLDPCSNEYSIVKAVVEYKLPKQNGLELSWHYPTIYVNPPYGADKDRGTTIKDWICKCAKMNELYVLEILALIPVATNTSHWKEYVWNKASAICFLYDTRLRFLIKGKDTGKGSPMACAMIYWGDQYKNFEKVFREFGAVVNLKNGKGNVT